MRSEYKILIVSFILVATLVVSSDIELTSSWYSDEEKMDANVSVMSITITDYGNNTVDTIYGEGWKWSLTGGEQYDIISSANTRLIISSGSVDGYTGSIPIGLETTTITVGNEGATLSLLPVPSS